MTQAKAQTVASALIGLGYIVHVTSQDGDWIVQAAGTDIAASSVASFATAQSVTGTVSSAKFL